MLPIGRSDQGTILPWRNRNPALGRNCATFVLNHLRANSQLS